jgi:hypothetical protein
MLSGKDSYRSSAEVASLISLYLLVGKTVLDAIPVSRRVVVFLVTWVRQHRAAKKTHADLSERLLEAAQDDPHQLELNDHAQLAVDQSHASIDLELPEEEDWDDFIIAPESEEGDPELDMDTHKMLPVPPTRLDSWYRPVISSQMGFNPNPLDHRSESEEEMHWDL